MRGRPSVRWWTGRTRERSVEHPRPGPKAAQGQGRATGATGGSGGSTAERRAASGRKRGSLSSGHHRLYRPARPLLQYPAYYAAFGVRSAEIGRLSRSLFSVSKVWGPKFRPLTPTFSYFLRGHIKGGSGNGG